MALAIARAVAERSITAFPFVLWRAGDCAGPVRLALLAETEASPSHASHERQHPGGDYDFQNL